MAKVHLLDYVAGNIRSLVNAIEKCGYEVEWIRTPEDVKNAEVRSSPVFYPLTTCCFLPFGSHTNWSLVSHSLPCFGQCLLNISSHLSIPSPDSDLRLPRRNSSSLESAISVTAFQVSPHLVSSQQFRRTLRPVNPSSAFALVYKLFSPARRKHQTSPV